MRDEATSSLMSLVRGEREWILLGVVLWLLIVFVCSVSGNLVGFLCKGGLKFHYGTAVECKEFVHRFCLLFQVAKGGFDQVFYYDVS